jgi:hypothetical protein
MADTPNLGITEMTEAQATKYVTFNHAILMLDALCQCKVVDIDRITAPTGIDGNCYIVAGIGGDWSSGTINDIAHYISGSGWYFYTPKEGWTCYDQDTNRTLIYDGAAWIATPKYLGSGTTDPAIGMDEGDTYFYTGVGLKIYVAAAWTTI